MRCEGCKVDYPEGLVNQFATNGSGNGQQLCGICALEATNRVHGSNRARFAGEKAEILRLSAIEYRAEREGGSQ